MAAACLALPQVLPSEGAGPLALYNALGGEAAAREGRIPA
jgi:hypothetical protein